MPKQLDSTGRLISLKNLPQWLLVGLFISTILGCGHGIDSSEGEAVDSTIDVMGVDGPLANADIALYKLQDYLDTSVDPYSGAILMPSTDGLAAVANGRSDDLGFASELVLSTDSNNGPFLLEVSSNADTLDLTTNDIPVIDTVRTIIKESEYTGEQLRFYATALTTLAVDRAVAQSPSVLRYSDLDQYDLTLSDVVLSAEGDVLADAVLASGQVWTLKLGEAELTYISLEGNTVDDVGNALQAQAGDWRVQYTDANNRLTVKDFPGNEVSLSYVEPDATDATIDIPANAFVSGGPTFSKSIITVQNNREVAANAVQAVYGFGLLDNVNLFSTSPVFDESTGTAEAQSAAAAYRAALETLAAVVEAVATNTSEDAAIVAQTLFSDFVDNGFNKDAAIFSEVEAAVATDLDNASTSYLATRLDGELIQATMNGELGAMSTWIDDVNWIAPLYGSPDSDNDGDANDVDPSPQNPVQYIETPLSFNFIPTANKFGQNALTFIDGDFTLTVTSEVVGSGEAGKLSKQKIYGLGVKTPDLPNPGNNDWKINVGEQVNFALTNDSGTAIPFKGIKFSVPGFPAFNVETDEANLIINGNTYTFNGRNGSGAREIDETSVVEGTSGWGSEEATSFSLTPLSGPIRFTEISITALSE